MRTTLHNHAFIDSEEKPLISNEDFKNLTIATRKVFELRFKYSLTKFQNFTINDLLDEKSINCKINYPDLFNNQNATNDNPTT